MNKILVTGGAGFIGSNLCEHLLAHNYEVVCLDNFATGKPENVFPLLERYSEKFKLIVGDIRVLADCRKAVEGVDYVMHEAALGSVPRSIKDPITTNDTNISGFLNMLVTARDAGVKRFIYAASSSTYGDSKSLPKVEDVIGKPLSPYAITKYVNELYADVFAKTYGMECIGLRYFNVFGRRQDPFGAYAAVSLAGQHGADLGTMDIEGFQQCGVVLGHHVILGDQHLVGAGLQDILDGEATLDALGELLDDLTALAMTTNNKNAVNQIYNTAYGERTTLNQLVGYLKEFLSEFDSEIIQVEVIHGPNRLGDIPHSLACIDKAKSLLGYNPQYSMREGLKEAVKWYWNNLI
mgnify:CR=1 FL=1